MDLSDLMVVGINPHHCEEVTGDLQRFMEKEDLHVVLIQEQWLVSNKVCNIRSIFYRMKISLA